MARLSGPGGGVAGRDGPPLAVPGSHFALAGLFLLAGAAGLVVVAPALARGDFLDPGVTAVTHLFTLGWITTSILGALHQLLPVVLERPFRWPSAALPLLALHGTGLLLLLAGMWSGRGTVTAAGAACLSVALLGFAAGLGLTLAGAPERGTTWWALAMAALFLVVTVLLGGALAANLGWGVLGGRRTLALGVHVHVALVGWVLLVMIGVAQRLLPMFLLSHGADERPGRAATGLVGAGVGLLVVGHHGPALLARWLPAGLVLAGAVAFLVQARAFYRHRRRPVLDPGMALAAGGLGVLTAGAVLALPTVAAGMGSPRLAAAYGLCLILGITLFVAAHYWKIVPFLVWLHRFGPRVGREPVPTVAELYDAGVARWAGRLLLVGAATTIGSVLAGWGGGARLGGLLVLAGTAAGGVQMTLVARRRPGRPGPAAGPEAAAREARPAAVAHPPTPGPTTS